MVAVDTNILVRFFTNDHPEQSPQARTFIQTAKPASLLLDRIIIEELGYVLRANYGFSKSKVGAAYQSLLATEVFSVPERELVEAAVRLFISEKPLSFEDSWLLALKRGGEVKDVLTFDAALQKRL